MRRQLRPAPTRDELAGMYPAPHDHTVFTDHLYRVEVTAAIAAQMCWPGCRVADLSCGDAAIGYALRDRFGAAVQFGDVAPGYEFHGPIEETIHQIEPVDLFVCSETLEHVADPDGLLAAIRSKAKQLILSTPEGEEDSSNPEHVWGWDSAEVRAMLERAGFVPKVYTLLDLRLSRFVYAFQIWACE